MTAMSRVIVGVNGSPGCLPAVRYAAELARAHHAPLIPVLVWQPPGGDLAERSHPAPALRELWVDAARSRLQHQIDFGFESETTRAREREVSAKRLELHRRIDSIRARLGERQTA